MQIKIVLRDDLLRISKVSWKFRIPTIYNFVVIYLPVKLPFLKK